MWYSGDTMSSNNKKKKLKSKPHPWQPEIKVWQEKELLYYDGPIATGRVVQINTETEVFRDELLFELSYHVGQDKSVLDPDGAMSVRWTKAELRAMLDLVEATEKELGISSKKQQQEEEEKKDDHPTTNPDSNQQQSGGNDPDGGITFAYTRPDWFSNSCG